MSSKPLAKPLWFDGHLDLACLAVNRRDMRQSPEQAGGPWQPGSITLPSLADGGVVAALGTIFTELDGKGPEGYPAGDADQAHKRGRAQMEVYQTWRDDGLVSLDLRKSLRVDAQVGAIRGGMGVSQTIPEHPAEKMRRTDRLTMGVLIECADPVRSPDELPWWVERGVVAIGMAWRRGSRYAGGNNQPGVGLTDLGHELVRAMDDHNVVHDVSHLSQQSTDDLFGATDRVVIASHSNCRDIFNGEGRTLERHIADTTIAEIGRRDGVVGINLVAKFLDDTLTHDGDRTATIGDVVRHVEHVCDVMGHRRGVALGSDADGGFSRKWLPEGIDHPRDYVKICDALREKGWSEEDLAGFCFDNWARVFAA
jgi:membrane dipeptidase